jgi:hypothetical protein
MIGMKRIRLNDDVAGAWGHPDRVVSTGEMLCLFNDRQLVELLIAR